MQMAELSKAVNAYKSRDSRGAIELLKAFKTAHHDSLWLPLADDLLRKTRFERDKLEGLNADRLRAVLVDLVTRWQSVALSEAVERLDPLRATFAELARANRDELVKLAGDEEPNTRAVAVFCLAFSPAPGDDDVVVASCADEHPRVRAWAAYGLAERGDPTTAPDLLERLLGDADEKVRQRACMAVRGCIRPGSGQQSRFAEILIRMVRTDPSDDVRWEAANVLKGLASAAHLDALIRLHADEDVPPIARVLKATIEQLGGQTRDDLPD
jgi:HEAT repeat protein